LSFPPSCRSSSARKQARSSCGDRARRRHCRGHRRPCAKIVCPPTSPSSSTSSTSPDRARAPPNDGIEIVFFLLSSSISPRSAPPRPPPTSPSSPTPPIPRDDANAPVIDYVDDGTSSFSAELPGKP
uniref:Uncharacterized protein n=1 Tax=Triticum urartu TaxID=4572 RepID=A0A8R7TSD9_TRIUA